MLISVDHATRYSYESEAGYSIQSLRLTPPSFDGQRVLSWRIDVPGAEIDPCSFDGFGNIVHLATFMGPHSEVVIRASGEVEIEDRGGVVTGLEEISSPWVYLRHTDQTRPGAEIAALAHSIEGDLSVERLHALSAAVREHVAYEVGATEACTTAAEALAYGRGVCQDHAHVFIACARSVGIPARYVTGYLVTGDLNDDAADSSGPSVVDAGEDGDGVSEAHHAWAEAWVSELGWVGFDVANGLCPTDRYVRLACGLDAEYAAPVRGSRRGGDAEALDVNVVVEQEQRPQQ